MEPVPAVVNWARCAQRAQLSTGGTNTHSALPELQ